MARISTCVGCSKLIGPFLEEGAYFYFCKLNPQKPIGELSNWNTKIPWRCDEWDGAELYEECGGSYVPQD